MAFAASVFTRKMMRSKAISRISIAGTILLAYSFVAGAQQLPPGSDPQPTPGLDAILSLRNRYAIVGIGEFPGCQEVYNFLAALLKDARFSSAFNDILVDFGNPRYQNLIDAYVGGEDIPFDTLKQVWQDTTDVGLWDSPLYAEFYDTVREVNALLAAGQHLRVVLGGAPIIWSTIKTAEEFQATVGAHEQSLASAINDSINQGHRALVIAGAKHLFRQHPGGTNARSLVEAQNPNQMAVVLAQSRLGGDLYTQVESAEAAWPLNSMAAISGTWLGALTLDGSSGSSTLQDQVDAGFERVSYSRACVAMDLPRPGILERAAPPLVAGVWHTLGAEGPQFDPRGRMADVVKPLANLGGPPTGAPPKPPGPDPTPVNAVDYILQALHNYPIVALGDQHMNEDFHDFVKALIRDPRLPGLLNDIVLEVGNPVYQSLVDAYVVSGLDVPYGELEQAWQQSAIGWYIANSPVYAGLIDAVRSLNLGLPVEQRIRVVLGDTPVDWSAVVAIQDFAAVQSSRDPALGESLIHEVELGRKALVIYGNGHLLKNGSQNARGRLEAGYPGMLFFIDPTIDPSTFAGSDASGWPTPSALPLAGTWLGQTPIAQTASGQTILLQDAEDSGLWLGPQSTWTGVRPGPEVYLPKEYWTEIQEIPVSAGQYPPAPLDPTGPLFSYTGAYFQPPLPGYTSPSIVSLYR
jgi:hypothetical protein